MDKRGAGHVEPGKFKETILVEIFDACRESATVFQKTTDPEIRQALLDSKRSH
jgi:hypothetical protein